jgi:hypothetical protein
MNILYRCEKGEDDEDIVINCTAYMKNEDVPIGYASIIVNKESGKALLDYLYNYFKVALEKVRNDDNSEKLKEWRRRFAHDKDLQNIFKGLGRSILYHAINHGVKEGVLKMNDTLHLVANGRVERGAKGMEFNNMLPLYEYYSKLGFTADAKYVENYKKAIFEIFYKKVDSKYSETVKIGRILDVEIDEIPMSGAVSTILENIKDAGLLVGEVV